MRRIAALIALFVLSLSRFGAMAVPTHAHARSIGRVAAHELAAPAVRLAPQIVRDAAPREPAHALTPWLPQPRAEFQAGDVLRRASTTAASVDLAALGEWRAFTYDATAPPTRS